MTADTAPLKAPPSTEIARVEAPAVPEAASDSTALMRLIERAATSPDFDVAKLDKLLDMKERWEATEARKAFVVARAAFKAEAPDLSKNKHVQFDTSKGRTEYDHATLDHIAETLSPVLSRHGLSYAWETEQSDGGMIRVACVLTHVMGHSERVALQAGADQSGGKNNIQALGSTVSYLSRYTLLAVTGMATKEQDDDGRGSELDLITAEQKETLIGLMKETGADTEKFLAYLGVPSLDELPAERFNAAVQGLEAKRKAAS